MRDAAESLLLGAVLVALVVAIVSMAGGVEGRDAIHRAFVRLLGGMP